MKIVAAFLVFFVSSFCFAEVKTVVVGHAANFSDFSKSSINPYNKAVSNGLEFAIEQFQKELKAKDLEIKIQDFDYGNREVLAPKAANAIIESPAVAAIGFYESGQSLLAAPLLEKAGVPLISPVASATRLFSIGRHFHPMSFSNRDMGRALAFLVKERLKARSVLLVPAADCAYCSDLANGFEEIAKKQGNQVLRVNVLNEDEVFDKLTKEVEGKKFDAVVVPNHELTSARIVAHLLKIGINAPFLGGDGWGNAGMVGFFKIVSDPKFEGYCVAHWHQDLTGELGKKFVKQWEQKYGKPPIPDSAIAFDSMRRLIMAILKAKAITRVGIQSELENMSTYDGVTGKAHYSQLGSSTTKPLVLLKSDVKTKTFNPISSFTPKGEK